MKKFVCSLLLALVAALAIAPAARAEDAKKAARLLFVSQSQGFKHGSVSRKEGQLSPAERAITELGVSSGLFRVDCTQ
ncbi:MAG TPA: ThuA domain-containing protein, partial [Pirellulaceae bacterium]|nr:ThuA domain-containing protein [Pirellulaceae bacterium]